MTFQLPQNEAQQSIQRFLALKMSIKPPSAFKTSFFRYKQDAGSCLKIPGGFMP